MICDDVTGESLLLLIKFSGKRLSVIKLFTTNLATITKTTNYPCIIANPAH